MQANDRFYTLQCCQFLKDASLPSSRSGPFKPQPWVPASRSIGWGPMVQKNQHRWLTTAKHHSSIKLLCPFKCVALKGNFESINANLSTNAEVSKVPWTARRNRSNSEDDCCRDVAAVVVQRRVFVQYVSRHFLSLSETNSAQK